MWIWEIIKTLADKEPVAFLILIVAILIKIYNYLSPNLRIVCRKSNPEDMQVNPPTESARAGAAKQTSYVYIENAGNSILYNIQLDLLSCSNVTLRGTDLSGSDADFKLSEDHVVRSEIPSLHPGERVKTDCDIIKPSFGVVVIDGKNESKYQVDYRKNFRITYKCKIHLFFGVYIPRTKTTTFKYHEIE